MTDNRHSLIVNVRTTQATGTAERDAATAMLADLAKRKRVTLAADKGYDTRGFVKTCWELGVTAHVAQNTRRTGGSAIDGRTLIFKESPPVFYLPSGNIRAKSSRDLAQKLRKLWGSHGVEMVSQFP